MNLFACLTSWIVYAKRLLFYDTRNTCDVKRWSSHLYLLPCFSCLRDMVKAVTYDEHVSH